MLLRSQHQQRSPTSFSRRRRRFGGVIYLTFINVIPVIISLYQSQATTAYIVIHPTQQLSSSTTSILPIYEPPHRRLWTMRSTTTDGDFIDSSSLLQQKSTTTTTTTIIAAIKTTDSTPSVVNNEWNQIDVLLPTIILVTSILISLSIMEPANAVAVTTTTTTVAQTAATATSAVVPIIIDNNNNNNIDWSIILQKAMNRAIGGGRAGALAAIVQVCTLMWLRTCMNYQYRYGGNLISSFQTLYKEGGIQRLYQGLPFALIQGPLTRFGDTAANVGILALFESIPYTQSLPLPIKTLCSSITAGLWRILLMPIDTSKTSLQVEGSIGLQKLYNATIEFGPSVLYRGSLAQAAATAVGHFPWFLTYNFFNDLIPIVDTTTTGAVVDPNTLMLLSLGRSALLGLLASCVSDCSSNSLRVIKTTKQTAQLNNDYSTTTMRVDVDDDGSTTPLLKTNKELTYIEVIRMIIDQDGISGLFGRGLQTRLLTNAIQGAMFSVLWKYFQQQQ